MNQNGQCATVAAAEVVVVVIINVKPLNTFTFLRLPPCPIISQLKPTSSHYTTEVTLISNAPSRVSPPLWS